MHENYKASKTRQEKEAEDASSIIYVKSYGVATLFFYSDPTLLCKLWESLTIAFGPPSSFGLLAMWLHLKEAD